MAAVLTIHRDEVGAMMMEVDAASATYTHLAKMADYFAVETAALSCDFTEESLGTELFRELVATKGVAIAARIRAAVAAL